MKSLRVINYIYYKVLTSQEEFSDKQLSHPICFLVMKTGSSIHHVTAALITRQMRVPLKVGLLFVVNNGSHSGTYTHTGITKLPTDSSPSPR